MDNESIKKNSRSERIFYSLGSVALVIFGLIYFENIIKPFVVAVLLWFMIDQLKEALGKIQIKGKSLPAGIRSMLAFLFVVIISYLATDILISNLEEMAVLMPEAMSNLNKYMQEASSFLRDPKYAGYLQKSFNSIDFPAIAGAILNSFSGIFTNLVVILVYVIFFLMEDTNRRNKIQKLFPDKGRKYNKIKHSLIKIADAVRAYIWQKTLISLITAALSFLILKVMGIDYAFMWSFLVFALNFIPYIGPLFSSLFPAIFAFLMSGDMTQFIYVFLAMEIVQIILGNFVEPKMLSKGTNLGPVWVLVALAFWGMIWGIAGMILAVPVTAVMVIVLSQIASTRHIATVLSEKGEIMELEE